MPHRKFHTGNDRSRGVECFLPAFVEALEARTMLSAVNVLTYHNDNARTGQNLQETTLTPSNVNSSDFGKLFTDSVDGQVYAEPLLVSNVNIPGKGVHNIVIVVTENDSVYAFDADSISGADAQPLWHVSLLDAREGITTIPSTDTGSTDLVPEIGITSTPVVDLTTDTVYVVDATKQLYRSGSVVYRQQLFALSITNGAEKFGGPATIDLTTNGSGDGSTDTGVIAFQALIQNQRSALLLSNGTIYIMWASHGDLGPYHGLVAAYNAANLSFVSALNVTADGSEGGIWEDGDGLATDSAGNLYLTTGNGTYDANTGGDDYGDSALKLAPGTLAVEDSFTPADQAYLDSNDLDLDAGGVVVLPPQRSTTPDTIVFGGKEGTLYLVNQNDMGGYNTTADQVVQEIPNATNGFFGTPAYFDTNLYYVGVNGGLQRYSFQHGMLALLGTSDQTFNWPGSSPVISANGTSNAIVWMLAKESNGNAELLAYSAGNITNPLWYSDQGGSRGIPGGYVKFTVPTVANGMVYVGTQDSLVVYGLWRARSAIATTDSAALSPILNAGASRAAFSTQPIADPLAWLFAESGEILA